jgi:ATP-binding cassette subfamily C protein LapB
MSTSSLPEEPATDNAPHAALRRLHAQFGVRERTAAQQSSRDDRTGVADRDRSGEVFGGDVFDQLRFLAAMWHLTPQGQAGAGRPISPLPSSGSAASPSVSPSPGPASIAVEAERLGLDVAFRRCPADGLTDQDLPCLVLLSSGQGCVVLARSGSGMLVVAGAAGEQRISARQIAGSASGTIVTVRPASGRHGAAPVGHADVTGQTASGAGVAASSGPATTPQPAAGVLMRHLADALSGQRPLLIQLILASVIINLFGMLLPLFSMAVFDRVIPHAAMETLWALALGIGLALILEVALRHARLKLFDAAGQSVAHALQGRLMSRLMGGRLDHLPRGTAAMVQPMNDLEAMSHLAPHLLISLLVELPFFVVLLVLIASIAGPVALAPLIGAGLLLGLHVLAHHMARAAHGQQGGHIQKHQQLLIDGISAAERIRITGAGPLLLARWDVSSDAAGYAAHHARYWSGLAAQASGTLVQAVVIASIIIGVYRIDAALMTIGALSASILLVNRAMMPISTATGLFFRALQVLQTAAPVAGLMQAHLEKGGEQGHVAAHDIEGDIEARRLCFSYPGEVRQALSEVSFAIRPGERVGIIGKAGCGKSTLLRLLVRLHEAQSGKLSLDGRDIRQFDPQTVRRAIGYMPQDAHLFDGSLEDNLVMGLGQVDRGEMARVARISGVEAFASQHPSGFSLPVGPGGERLSGGERQAVSFARALMGSPRLLVLDEPTAALDNAAEARVIAELGKEFGREPGQTSLIVATHRLPVLALTDRIIWMDGGRIVADGPKAEIFARFGLAA